MAKSPRSSANPALKLAAIRRIHIYISVFIAPSVLLFAATGALQVFRIPDHTKIAVIAQLASVHKNQTFPPVKAGGGEEGGPRPQEPPQAGAPGQGNGAAGPAGQPSAAKGPQAPGVERRAPPKPRKSTVLLQWFSALIGAGLTITTLFGLWMALAYNRERALLWGLLAVGLLIPAALLVVSAT